MWVFAKKSEGVLLWEGYTQRCLDSLNYQNDLERAVMTMTYTVAFDLYCGEKPLTCYIFMSKGENDTCAGVAFLDNQNILPLLSVKTLQTAIQRLF